LIKKSPIEKIKLRVNDGGFTDIGITDKTNRDGVLDFIISGVVLDELQEVISTQSLGGVQKVTNEFFLVIQRVAEDAIGGKVRLLVLSVGLEEDGGEFPSQNIQPLLSDLLRNKIDFVKDQDDSLVTGHTENFGFKFFISTSHRVSGIENFKNNLKKEWVRYS